MINKLIAQSSAQKNMIIDSVLAHTHHLLGLDSMPYAPTYLKQLRTIRIIDLTNSYDSCSNLEGMILACGGFYNKHDVIIRKKGVISTLNNGQYSDVLFLNQNRTQNLLQLTTSVCDYFRRFGYQICYAYLFDFDIGQSEIRLLKCQIYELQ